MLSNIDIVMLCVNGRVGGRRLLRVAITVETIQDLIIDAPPRCVSPIRLHRTSHFAGYLSAGSWRVSLLSKLGEMYLFSNDRHVCFS